MLLKDHFFSNSKGLRWNSNWWMIIEKKKTIQFEICYRLIFITKAGTGI